ncbi:unnamed protein product [Plutella xylostella]|uniref:(diamondback moth) hypothetical protein n=1 Tax=Plutella xylostella TaxID=51655 RepID=A0A8S4EQ02_PLUXY|nr:unnamed protein product [Plutella xylostella]
MTFFAVLYPLRLHVARRRSRQMLAAAWLSALACSVPQHAADAAGLPGTWGTSIPPGSRPGFVIVVTVNSKGVYTPNPPTQPGGLVSATQTRQPANMCHGAVSYLHARVRVADMILETKSPTPSRRAVSAGRRVWCVESFRMVREQLVLVPLHYWRLADSSAYSSLFFTKRISCSTLTTPVYSLILRSSLGS